MLETELWKKVRAGLGDKWRGHRIENRINAGTPDVFFTLILDGVRSAGMLELKCQEPGKRGGINAKHYTQEQRDFATLHDAVLLMLYSNGWYVLFDSVLCDEILRGQSFNWHIENSIYASLSPDWSEVALIIKSSLAKAHHAK